jgi:glycosyltransferase involved in cell wall biosynthesis
MKVLFGSFSAITVLGGGVEVQMRCLARELRALGVDVDLFDPWERYDLSQYDFFHLFGSHVGTYHLGRAMHSLGMRLLVTPVFYSRQPAARVAAMVAAAGHLRKRGGFWTEHMFCKELCEMAECVLPNTSDELEMIARGFGVRREAMIEIPNGVEERFYHAAPDLFEQQFGLRDFVLYVGHIGWGRKNVLPFVKTLVELKLPAVLVGPVIQNEYSRKCQALIQAVDHIKLVPGLPADSPFLESAYAACDTLILPSMYETPGIAALEAGLAGAKVCITQFGGTREYFGDLAEYLDPRSESSIADALTRSMAKPKDSRLREHIHGTYLWSHAGKRLADAYVNLKQKAN